MMVMMEVVVVMMMMMMTKNNNDDDDNDNIDDNNVDDDNDDEFLIFNSYIVPHQNNALGAWHTHQPHPGHFMNSLCSFPLQWRHELHVQVLQGTDVWLL